MSEFYSEAEAREIIRQSVVDEKLIEEAAIAIHSVAESGASWFDARMADKAQHRSEARAVLAVFEKALGEATVTPTDDEREARAIVRRAVGGVLFHVTHFPERAQSHLLGENLGPLNEKITDAVLGALRRSEVPEPQAEPSDAQVRAAINAFNQYRHANLDVSLRAALRAAGEVQ